MYLRGVSHIDIYHEKRHCNVSFITHPPPPHPPTTTTHDKCHAYLSIFSYHQINASIKCAAPSITSVESVISTLFFGKSESIRFIGSADPLKLLLKSAIRRKFLAKSADRQTFHPSPRRRTRSLSVYEDDFTKIACS